MLTFGCGARVRKVVVSGQAMKVTCAFSTRCIPAITKCRNFHELGSTPGIDNQIHLRQSAWTKPDLLEVYRNAPKFAKSRSVLFLFPFPLVCSMAERGCVWSVQRFHRSESAAHNRVGRSNCIFFLMSSRTGFPSVPHGQNSLNFENIRHPNCPRRTLIFLSTQRYGQCTVRLLGFQMQAPRSSQPRKTDSPLRY